MRIDWPARLENALPLLQGCGALFGGPPTAVRTLGGEELPGFASVVLEFGPGRVAQLTLGTKGSARRIAVIAERGRAVAEWPGRLAWRDNEGRHLLVLPQVGERRLLVRFAKALRQGAPSSDLEEGHAALTWLRAARASLAEGRRVKVG